MSKRERLNEIMASHAATTPPESLKWLWIGLSLGWDACNERAGEVLREAIDREEPDNYED